MLSFLLIFAFGVGALLLAQSLDIECVNPQPPRRRVAREITPAPAHKGLLRQY